MDENLPLTADYALVLADENRVETPRLESPRPDPYTYPREEETFEEEKEEEKSQRTLQTAPSRAQGGPDMVSRGRLDLGLAVIGLQEIEEFENPLDYHDLENFELSPEMCQILIGARQMEAIVKGRGSRCSENSIMSMETREDLPKRLRETPSSNDSSLGTPPTKRICDPGNDPMIEDQNDQQRGDEKEKIMHHIPAAQQQIIVDQGPITGNHEEMMEAQGIPGHIHVPGHPILNSGDSTPLVPPPAYEEFETPRDPGTLPAHDFEANGPNQDQVWEDWAHGIEAQILENSQGVANLYHMVANLQGVLNEDALRNWFCEILRQNDGVRTQIQGIFDANMPYFCESVREKIAPEMARKTSEMVEESHKNWVEAQKNIHEKMESQIGQLSSGLEKTKSDFVRHGTRLVDIQAEMPRLRAGVLETQGLKKDFKVMERVILQIQKNSLEIAQNVPTCEQVKREMEMLLAKAQLDMTRDLHHDGNLGRDQNLKIWEKLTQAQEAQFEAKLSTIEKQALAREEILRGELLKNSQSLESIRKENEELKKEVNLLKNSRNDPPLSNFGEGREKDIWDALSSTLKKKIPSLSQEHDDLPPSSPRERGGTAFPTSYPREGGNDVLLLLPG